MSGVSQRGRNDRGLVLPAAALVASVVTVAAAAVGYVLTAHPSPPTHAISTPVTKKVTPKPVPHKTTPPKHPHHHRARVDKSAVYVEVFNNSNVPGLAGRTATRAQDAGWNVVGSSNWYGTIASPTVYYPQRLEAAAKKLAHDLGIHRLKPAISPMRFDRLTVILTAGYQP